MKSIINFLFLFLSCSPLLIAQSAWTEEKDDFYLQVNYTSIGKYSNIYGDPDYKTSREISDNTLQVYGAYGLTEDITIIGAVPIKILKAGEIIENPTSTPLRIQEGNYSTIGNIVVGINKNWTKEKWVISTQLNVELPTGNYKNSYGLRSGYDAWSFIPTVQIGRSFHEFYFQANTGFDFKTNDYSESWRIGGEVGKQFFNQLWLVGFAEFRVSFKNGDYLAPVENLQTALYINDQEFGALGVKLIEEIGPLFGITAAYGGAIFGNNVPKREAFSIGVFLNL